MKEVISLSEMKSEKVMHNDSLLEQEIENILSSLNLTGGSEGFSSEFTELLERYGVKEDIIRDVQAMSAHAANLPESYTDDNLYSDDLSLYPDVEEPYIPPQPEAYHPGAGRVIYDEDYSSMGNIYMKKTPQTPYYYDENGFRVIYDEDLVNGRGSAPVPERRKPLSAESYIHSKTVKEPDLEGFTVIYKEPDIEVEVSERETEVSGANEKNETPSDLNSLIDPISNDWIDYNAKGKKKEKKAHAAKGADSSDNSEKDTESKAVRFFKSFLPWKGDPGKEIARKVIMLASICIIVYYSIYFINYFAQYYGSINDMNDLADLATEYDNSNDTSSVWETIRAKYPNVNFPEKLNPKWANLYAINQDFGGWISIGNTNIDDIVVKSSDNKDYLKTNFYGKENKYGTLFLDYRNFRNGFEELDRNTIIHGHNMKDGLKFAQLEKYMTPEGFAESPIIIYETPYQKYYWKVYAVIVTNGLPKDDNGYLFNYIVPNFTSDEAFMKYIKALDERKLYDTGVGMLPTDKILTLSTCSYEFKEARLAVIARLVRNGESLDVDTSLVKVNPNPRYPQAWYDAKKLPNPYKDAYKWQP